MNFQNYFISESLALSVFEVFPRHFGKTFPKKGVDSSLSGPYISKALRDTNAPHRLPGR